MGPGFTGGVRAKQLLIVLIRWSLKGLLHELHDSLYGGKIYVFKAKRRLMLGQIWKVTMVKQNQSSLSLDLTSCLIYDRSTEIPDI
jgi:hypothetical protein